MSMLNGIPPLTRDELDEAIRCNPDRKETVMSDSKKCAADRHVYQTMEATVYQPHGAPQTVASRTPIMCQCAWEGSIADSVAGALYKNLQPYIGQTICNDPASHAKLIEILSNQSGYSVDGESAVSALQRIIKERDEFDQRCVRLTNALMKRVEASTAGSTRAELAEVIDETAPFTKEQIKKTIEFLEDYKAKTPGILAMGTPDVATLGGQPVYFDGKPLLRERPNQDKAVFSHVSLVPAGEGTGKVLGKFQAPNIKPDPKLAELMAESTKTLLDKIHHTKVLILAIASGAGVSVAVPINIEPFFNGTKTDGFTVRNLRVKKMESARDNPLPAMQLLDRALANVGLEVSECTQSLPDERAASFTFRLKTTEFFVPKYLAWIDSRLNHGEAERMAEWRKELEGWMTGAPTLIAKSTEIDPDRDKSLTNIRQPWKGPDESKSLHANLVDFFTVDVRDKKK